MPLVSDPGYLLVRACVAAGLPVEVLPGPSAAIAALVASGLPAAEWRFPGFLPRKKGELRQVLSEPGGTLVAFESPRRVPATLAVLAELEPEREVAVCRELTKVHEEVVRGTAAELAARYVRRRRRRARWCWSWLPRRSRATARPAGLDGAARAGGRGREAAPRRRRGGRPDRRERERAVPAPHGWAPRSVTGGDRSVTSPSPDALRSVKNAHRTAASRPRSAVAGLASPSWPDDSSPPRRSPSCRPWPRPRRRSRPGRGRSTAR